MSCWLVNKRKTQVTWARLWILAGQVGSGRSWKLKYVSEQFTYEQPKGYGDPAGWMTTGQVSWRGLQANSTEKTRPFPIDLRRPRALAAHQKVGSVFQLQRIRATEVAEVSLHPGFRLSLFSEGIGGKRHSRVCIHNTYANKIKQARARESVVGSTKTKCGGEPWDAVMRNLGCWAQWQSLTQQQQQPPHT